MTEREALLRVVCESPADDVPRLVFADWLDEHGEPERAEFIRLQCANVRFRRPTQMTGEQYQELNRIILRDLDLLQSHGDKWRAELLRRPGLVWGGFRRGFINSLQARIGADGATLQDLDVIGVTVPLERLGLKGSFGFDDLVRLAFIRRLDGLWLGELGWKSDDWQRFGEWRLSMPALSVSVEVFRPAMTRTIRRWLKEDCRVSLMYPPH